MLARFASRAVAFTVVASVLIVIARTIQARLLMSSSTWILAVLTGLVLIEAALFVLIRLSFEDGDSTEARLVTQVRRREASAAQRRSFQPTKIPAHIETIKRTRPKAA
jgi:low affinity Fe/Cu permease